MTSKGLLGTQLLKPINHLLCPYPQEKRRDGTAQGGGKENPTVLAWSAGQSPYIPMTN